MTGRYEGEQTAASADHSTALRLSTQLGSVALAAVLDKLGISASFSCQQPLPTHGMNDWFSARLMAAVVGSTGGSTSMTVCAVFPSALLLLIGSWQ